LHRLPAGAFDVRNIVLGVLLAGAVVLGILAMAVLRTPTPLPKPVVARVPPPPPPVIYRAAPAPVFRRGERIGEIEVPRLKLAVPIYEGDDAAILDRGAGHVPGTALPGDAGNVCIAAHRDKFFRALRFIKPHDEIVLETKDGPLRYVVNSTSVVNPGDVRVLMPAPKRDLTLVTCFPFFYVGSAPHRFIVHASREG
jgi:sortase A